jgi:hypothetical protein
MPLSPDQQIIENVELPDGGTDTSLLLAELGTPAPRTPPSTGFPLPTGSYWDAHHYLGEFRLGPESRVLVSAVCKAGEWFVRLRTYRRAERGGRAQWLHTTQLMLFPAAAVPALQDVLTGARAFIAAR